MPFFHIILNFIYKKLAFLEFHIAEFGFFLSDFFAHELDFVVIRSDGIGLLFDILEDFLKGLFAYFPHAKLFRE